MTNADLRVLIVAEHASLKFGGEAVLPLYYFKLYRKRGIETWMLVHARTRDELREELGQDFDRVYFIEDTLLHRWLWKIGTFVSVKVDEQTFGVIRHIWSQWLQRRLARRIIPEHRINVIHEVMPVSPKETSMTHGLGVPNVIGPMSGGMSYPPAFESRQGRGARIVERFGRIVAHVLHQIVRGKIMADVLLVANQATRDALPRGARGKICELVEIGVHRDLWQPAAPHEKPDDGKVRFVFLGRLINWKAVDLLLEAFKPVAAQCPRAMLQIIGDGPEKSRLEEQARELKIDDRVEFTGWLPQTECARRLRIADVLVLPSLRECGGAVVLEAMAMGLPVIATRWGGPAIYLDDHSGIRVSPDSREGFIRGLTDAMIRLADSSELRRKMGEAARMRCGTNYFDWDSKAGRILEIFRETISLRQRDS